MKKKYADFKLGVPDYVTVETEDERLVCQGGQPTERPVRLPWNFRMQVNMRIYLLPQKMQ